MLCLHICHLSFQGCQLAGVGGSHLLKKPLLLLGLCLGCSLFLLLCFQKQSP